MVEAIEKFTHIACFHGPLQGSFALEHVVLEAASIATDPVLVRPAQHAFAMHHFVLEVTNVASTVWPLEHSIMVDLVVEQGPGIDTAVRPALCSLSRGSVVFKHTSDHCPRGKAMAAWPHNLAVMPETLELCSIRPVEGTMALELTVV